MVSDSTASAAPAPLMSRLARDETLIWWDRPVPMLFARKEANAGLLAGLFVLAFMLFWIYGASRAGGAFALFGLPGLAVGLWIVSGPFRAYRRASGMLFALTNRRALIITAGVTKSVPLEQIRFVESEGLAEGAGHVYFFEEAASFMPWGWNYPQPLQKSGFFGVKEADRIASALLDLIQKRGSIGASAAMRE